MLLVLVPYVTLSGKWNGGSDELKWANGSNQESKIDSVTSWPFTISFHPSARYKVSKPSLSLAWKFEVRKSANSDWAPAGMPSTQHTKVFVTYDTPLSPMSPAWTTVIQQACTWAEGKTTTVDAVTGITKGLHWGAKYNKGLYRGFTTGVQPTGETFYLNCFLNAQQRQGDCLDFGNYDALLCASIGIGAKPQMTNPELGANEWFTTTRVYPAGQEDTGANLLFFYHQFTRYTNIYDSALRFTQTGDPPVNMPENNYKDTLLLTWTDGWSWSPTTPSMPSLNTDWYPTVSDVHVRPEDITRSSAIIRWKTNVAGTSKVRWGTTQGGPYPNESPEHGIFPSVRHHTVSLGSLNSNTTYYYNVRSSGGPWSAEYSFKTLP